MHQWWRPQTLTHNCVSIANRWDLVEATGDDSSFVAMVRRVLLECGPRIGADLDGVNFAFFCDKVGMCCVVWYMRSC